MGIYVNSADPVQIPQNAASDWSLHCLLTRFLAMQNSLEMKTSFCSILFLFYPITLEGPQGSTDALKHPTETPKTRNGLIQIMKMDKFTSQLRVKDSYTFSMY